MMNTTGHIPLDELADFLAARLPEEAAAEVNAHLATGCVVCAQNKAFLVRLNAAAEAARWSAPPAQLRRKVVNALHTPAAVRSHSPQGWARRLVPISLTVIALLIVLVITLRPVTAFAASLSNISGKVEVRLTPSAAWQSATSGQTFPVGAEIRTDAEGRVDLLFPGGDLMQLAPGTQLLLSQASHSGGKWNIVLQQTTGGIETWVQPGSTGYNLETSAGTVITRGAHFQMTVQEGGTTRVSVEDGEISVDSAGGSAILRDGEMTTFAPGSVPTTLPIPSSETPSPSTEKRNPISTLMPGGGQPMETPPNNPVVTPETETPSP